MTFLQEDMLENIEEYIKNMTCSVEMCNFHDDFGDYDTEYKTCLWTMSTLKNEIQNSSVEPLKTIEKFRNEMKTYAIKNPIFYYSINCIDEFLLGVL